MIFITAALTLSTAFANIDALQRRVVCDHLLQAAEALHESLVSDGIITSLEAERTLIVPGFESRPTKNLIARLWRRFDHERPVAVAIKPSGQPLVFEIKSGHAGGAQAAAIKAGAYVDVPWFGVLPPKGEGDLAWETPLPELPVGDVTKRALYEQFQGVIDPMVKTGRLKLGHMKRAIVLEGKYEGRTVKVLRTLPESESQFMVFDDASGTELTPSPDPELDQYIELKDGRRLTMSRNLWWSYWPRGLAKEFAAAARFPSWKEFLKQFPEAIDSLPGLPYVSRDIDLENTIVLNAVDEDDQQTFNLVIMRRNIRRYGETPPANYGLWDPKARAWVDVLHSRPRTFSLTTRNRVGLHLNGKVGWSELPPVSEIESFAREL